MTARRSLALAMLAALPLALAACDNKCPTETAQIQAGGVPTCTGGNAVQASAQVTVKLHVCPRCDQAFDNCIVTPPQGDKTYQLDPLVQVCTPSNSCPAPSCSVVTCSFQAPTTPDTYAIAVVDPGGAIIPGSFEVVAAGGATSCGG